MGNYRNFTLTTYFVARATATVTREHLEKQLDFMLKHLRLDKVYLEPWRGELASHEQVEMCREVFESRGVKVAGGITTVIPTPEGDKPKQRLFSTFCYNDPKMRAKLREVSAFTGAHFDEFIIDDFFFTNCMCPACVREKNAWNAAHGITDGSWQAYRLDLLRRVSETGIERIRFMTSHPKDLSDELIDEMAHNPVIAPHLHLPVQSGNDRILHEMNRRYTREHYLRRVQALRSAMPRIGLTTDLIVAFPGETEQEFSDTLSLVEEVRYDSAYTFIYSPRKGTRAAEMPGAIDPDVASERIERLIAAQERITGKILAGMNGEIAQVLVEGASRRRPNQLTGKSGRNINVNFNGDAADIGKIIPVRVTGAGSNTLRGEKEV